MALTNHERVDKALHLLRVGLGSFVDRELQVALKSGVLSPQSLRSFLDDPLLAKKPPEQWVVAALLKLMWDTWNDVFR